MNEEVNNNYNNTPNYNYEKNSSGVKVLLIILIILVLCLIGLTCYKMFIYDKKNDNKKDNNVAENNNNQENNNNTNNNKDKYEKINYEIKDEIIDIDSKISGKVLYIDNKKVDLDYPLVETMKVEQFKDLLIVDVGGPGPSNDIYAVDKDGNVITFLNLSEQLKLKKGYVCPSCNSYRLDGNNLYKIVKIQYTQANFDQECRFENPNETLESYEIKYEYLDNQKFSDGEIINKKTMADYTSNYNCDVVTVFTDLISGKLCSRKNNKISCFDIKDNATTKQNMISIFGEDNCKTDNINKSFSCESGVNSCTLDSNDKQAFCSTDSSIYIND